MAIGGGGLGDATTSCCNGNWKMFDFGNFFISRYRLGSMKGLNF